MIKLPERWLTETVNRAIDMNFSFRFMWGAGTISSGTRTPRPRSTEDAHPSRISTARNVTTPMGVWLHERGVPSEPVSQRQRRQILQRDKIAQEANASTPKGTGKT
jgi:hypothetical protein